MRFALTIVAVAAATVLASCGDGVHTGCTVDADCSGRCAVDTKDFPGGLCTMSCTKNDDCPGDNVCIDKQNGVCVPTCGSQEECSDFGPGWLCKDKDDITGVKHLVCLGD